MAEVPGTPRVTGVWAVPAQRTVYASAAGNHEVVAIDEQTALVGDGVQWSVHGVGGVYVHQGGEWVGEYRAGDTWELTMPLAGAAPAAG